MLSNPRQRVSLVFVTPLVYTQWFLETVVTTTTTIRPTPSHRPGLFAPPKPLGPAAFFAKGKHSDDVNIFFQILNIVDNTQAQYVQVQQQPGGLNYFDRYSPFIPGETRQLFQDPQVYFKEAEKFVGKSFAEFLQLANKYLFSST